MIWKIAFLLAAFVGSATSHYMIGWCKTMLKKSKKAAIKEINNQISINDILSDISHKLGAYRVAIVNYDKGKAFMTYESPNNIQNSIIQKFQGIITSPLAGMLLDLERDGMVVVNKDSGHDINMIHKAIGISTSYKYKLYNTINQGTLVIAFDIDRPLTDEEHLYINNQIVSLRLLKLK